MASSQQHPPLPPPPPLPPTTTMPPLPPAAPPPPPPPSSSAAPPPHAHGSSSSSTNATTSANVSRWFFDPMMLKDTPSVRSGLQREKELSYRQQAANFIQDMGQRLQVTQLCINTAIVYMQRFYMFHSFTRFHRNTIAAASLFLAAKVEEQPRKLEHVIKVAHICLHRDQPQLDSRSEAYLEQAAELVANENILLQTLGFDVAIDHPHTHVVKCCQLVKATKELAQTSYFMATNSLHLTTMCLRYPPTIVACVCIHLACKWSKYKINTSTEGKEWFKYVDPLANQELLEKLTEEFLVIFDKCPSRLKKKIMASTEATKQEEERRMRGDISASQYQPDFSVQQEASSSTKAPSASTGSIAGQATIKLSPTIANHKPHQQTMQSGQQRSAPAGVSNHSRPDKSRHPDGSKRAPPATDSYEEYKRRKTLELQKQQRPGETKQQMTNRLSSGGSQQQQQQQHLQHHRVPAAAAAATGGSSISNGVPPQHRVPQPHPRQPPQMLLSPPVKQQQQQATVGPVDSHLLNRHSVPLAQSDTRPLTSQQPAQQLKPHHSHHHNNSHHHHHPSSQPFLGDKSSRPHQGLVNPQDKRSSSLHPQQQQQQHGVGASLHQQRSSSSRSLQQPPNQQQQYLPGILAENKGLYPSSASSSSSNPYQQPKPQATASSSATTSSSAAVRSIFDIEPSDSPLRGTSLGNLLDPITSPANLSDVSDIGEMMNDAVSMLLEPGEILDTPTSLTGIAMSQQLGFAFPTSVNDLHMKGGNGGRSLGMPAMSKMLSSPIDSKQDIRGGNGGKFSANSSLFGDDHVDVKPLIKQESSSFSAMVAANSFGVASVGQQGKNAAFFNANAAAAKTKEREKKQRSSLFSPPSDTMVANEDGSRMRSQVDDKSAAVKLEDLMGYEKFRDGKKGVKVRDERQQQQHVNLFSQTAAASVTAEKPSMMVSIPFGSKSKSPLEVERKDSDHKEKKKKKKEKKEKKEKRDKERRKDKDESGSEKKHKHKHKDKDRERSKNKEKGVSYELASGPSSSAGGVQIQGPPIKLTLKLPTKQVTLGAAGVSNDAKKRSRPPSEGVDGGGGGGGAPAAKMSRVMGTNPEMESIFLNSNVGGAGNVKGGSGGKR